MQLVSQRCKKNVTCIFDDPAKSESREAHNSISRMACWIRLVGGCLWCRQPARRKVSRRGLKIKVLLIAWLRKWKVIVRVPLEAIGIYSLNLSVALHDLAWSPHDVIRT
jgi:hypothetical protein